MSRSKGKEFEMAAEKVPAFPRPGYSAGRSLRAEVISPVIIDGARRRDSSPRRGDVACRQRRQALPPRARRAKAVIFIPGTATGVPVR